MGYDSGIRVDYAKSFERLDHGVMSAYLLQMYLDWICDSMNIMHGVGEAALIGNEGAAKKTMIITLLEAISSHTNKNMYTYGFAFIHF